MKKYVIFLMFLLICNLGLSQDLISIDSVIPDSAKDSVDGEDIANLISRLDELLLIDEENRSVIEWREIIEIILKVSFDASNQMDMLFIDLVSTLQRLQVLEEERQDQISLLDNIIEDMSINIDKLKQNYYEINKSALYIQPSLSVHGLFDINILYTYDIFNVFTIGGGFGIGNITNIDNAGIDFNFNIMIGFLF